MSPHSKNFAVEQSKRLKTKQKLPFAHHFGPSVMRKSLSSKKRPLYISDESSHLTQPSSSHDATLHEIPPDSNANFDMTGNILHNRYLLLHLKKQCRLGQIYIATDLRFGGDFVLKLIYSHFLNEPELLDAFVAEYQLVTSLCHPSIARVFQLEEDPSTQFLFYIMELPKGETLRTKLDNLSAKSQHLPTTKALHILKYLGSILGHIHQKGLVHGHFQPELIHISDTGWKLQTPALYPQGAEHQTGTCAETQSKLQDAYTAPEHFIDGEPLTPATDIYSFGALAHLLLTGQLPGHERSLLEHIHPECREKLNKALQKAMHPQAHQRSQTIVDALQAIEKSLQPALQKVGKRTKILKKLTNAPSRTTTNDKILSHDRIKSESTSQPFHGISGDNLREQIRELRSIVSSVDSSTKTVKKQLEEQHSCHRIRAHRASIQAMACSLDGKWLATGCQGGHIKIWDTHSWSLRLSLTHPKGQITSLSWDPKGKYLLSGNTDDSVRIWDLSSIPAHLPLRELGPASQTQWSECGKYIVLNTYYKGILVVDPQSRRVADSLSTSHGPNRVLHVQYNQLVSSQDNHITIWDLERGQVLKQFKQRGQHIRKVLWHPNQNSLFLVSDSACYQIDSSSGKIMQTFTEHHKKITAILCTLKTQSLLTCSDGGLVHQWCTKTGKKQNTFGHTRSPVTALQVHPQERWLTVARKDGTLERWNVQRTK